jgi:hypothetical protein
MSREFSGFFSVANPFNFYVLVARSGPKNEFIGKAQ